MNVFERPPMEPHVRLQVSLIDELAGRVQSVLAATRELRRRSLETRRQVEQAAHLRREWRDVNASAGRRRGPAVRGAANPQSTHLPAAADERPMMSLLTRRMRQILELLVQGQSEKEVAHHLGLSPHTVHIHVTRMYTRLGVNSRAELLARFYRQEPASNPN